MGYLNELIGDVDRTHRNLGNLVAILQIVVKARKMVLIVSPSGCGKSRGMELIYKQTPDAMKRDKLTSAGLGGVAEELCSFRSAFIIDDIANCQTDYLRKNTISTLSSLVYSHIIQSQTKGNEYSIEDFYGSAIAGIQPVLLRLIMLEPEWDASIQDKVLRYYHLYRPLEPNEYLPDVKLDYGIDIDKVIDFQPDYNNKTWKKLVSLASSQWSRARVKEHLKDMLKAIAALEKREEVIEDDYKFLLKLLKPMSIENIVVRKDSLEGERLLDNDTLALLTQYYSYDGRIDLGHVCLDFKVKLSQGYKIMAKLCNKNGNPRYWQQISKKSPALYAPTEELLEELKLYGLELKNRG